MTRFVCFIFYQGSEQKNIFTVVMKLRSVNLLSFASERHERVFDAGEKTEKKINKGKSYGTCVRKTGQRVCFLCVFFHSENFKQLPGELNRVVS